MPTSIHYFPLKFSDDVSAVAITTGPDHHLWITTTGETSRVECMTSTGEILKVVTLEPGQTGNAPSAIISADGDLWVTEYTTPIIERITTEGEETRYTTSGLDPLNLASGPNGDIWITEAGKSIDQLGHISAQGVQQPNIPLTMQPEGIAIDGSGTIWFTVWPAGSDPDRSGFIESLVDGTQTFYSFPTHCLPVHNGPAYDNGNDITIGPNEQIWVVEGGIAPPSIPGIAHSS